MRSKPAPNARSDWLTPHTERPDWLVRGTADPEENHLEPPRSDQETRVHVPDRFYTRTRGGLLLLLLWSWFREGIRGGCSLHVCAQHTCVQPACCDAVMVCVNDDAATINNYTWSAFLPIYCNNVSYADVNYKVNQTIITYLNSGPHTKLK